MNLFGIQLFGKKSGTKEHYNAIGDEKKLRQAARILKTEVKKDKRGLHLDLTPNQAKRAKAMGAEETQDRWY